jgi:hypothetical protein
MGSYRDMTKEERRVEATRWRTAAREAHAKLTAQRMALADKIVMVIVDEVSNAIVRPGPNPEERECYVMARELREHSSRLRDLVVAVLAVDAGET